MEQKILKKKMREKMKTRMILKTNDKAKVIFYGFIFLRKFMRRLTLNFLPESKKGHYIEQYHI